MSSRAELAQLSRGRRVVRAVAADLPAIVGLLSDDPLGATREHPGDPAYERAFAAIDADPAHDLVVVLDGDTVVGTLQLTLLPGLSRTGTPRAQIESVRIADEARGDGLGRELFGWAIERARERGAGLVQLTTDAQRTRAQDFYTSLGFEPSHVGMKLTL